MPFSPIDEDVTYGDADVAASDPAKIDGSVADIPPTGAVEGITGDVIDRDDTALLSEVEVGVGDVAVGGAVSGADSDESIVAPIDDLADDDPDVRKELGWGDRFSKEEISEAKATVIAKRQEKQRILDEVVEKAAEINGLAEQGKAIEASKKAAALLQTADPTTKEIIMYQVDLQPATVRSMLKALDDHLVEESEENPRSQLYVDLSVIAGNMDEQELLQDVEDSVGTQLSTELTAQERDILSSLYARNLIDIADFEIEKGNADKARLLTETAVAFIKEHGVADAQCDVLRSASRKFDELNDKDKAISSLHEAMDAALLIEGRWRIFELKQIAHHLKDLGDRSGLDIVIEKLEEQVGAEFGESTYDSSDFGVDMFELGQTEKAIGMLGRSSADSQYARARLVKKIADHQIGEGNLHGAIETLTQSEIDSYEIKAVMEDVLRKRTNEAIEQAKAGNKTPDLKDIELLIDALINVDTYTSETVLNRVAKQLQEFDVDVGSIILSGTHSILERQGSYPARRIAEASRSLVLAHELGYDDLSEAILDQLKGAYVASEIKEIDQADQLLVNIAIALGQRKVETFFSDYHYRIELEVVARQLLEAEDTVKLLSLMESILPSRTLRYGEHEHQVNSLIVASFRIVENADSHEDALEQCRRIYAAGVRELLSRRSSEEALAFAELLPVDESLYRAIMASHVIELKNAQAGDPENIIRTLGLTEAELNEALARQFTIESLKELASSSPRFEDTLNEILRNGEFKVDNYTQLLAVEAALDIGHLPDALKLAELFGIDDIRSEMMNVAVSNVEYASELLGMAHVDSYYGNQELLIGLIDNFGYLPEKVQEKIRADAYKFFSNLNQDNEQFEESLNALSKIVDNKYDLKAMYSVYQQFVESKSRMFERFGGDAGGNFDLLKALADNPDIIDAVIKVSEGFYGFKVEDIDVMRVLSQRPEVVQFVQELRQYNFSFDPKALEQLYEMEGDRERILSELETILEENGYINYLPFREETSGQYIYEPMLVWASMHRASWQESLGKLLDTKPSVVPRYAAAVAHIVRLNLGAEVNAEQIEASAAAIVEVNELLGKNSKNGFGAAFRRSNISTQILERIVLRPSEIESFKRIFANEDFLGLLEPGAPLFSNREKIIADIFGNGNVEARIAEITAIFTKAVPSWKQRFLFAETRLGSQLAQAQSDYRVTEIVRIQTPEGNNVENFADDFEFATVPFTSLSVDEKRRVANLEDMSDAEVESLTELPLTQLNGMQKKLLFAYWLAETIETSRDETSKSAADERNRALVRDKLELRPGQWVHGSSNDFLELVLLNGNLPGEALGESASNDSYPFHVDFTLLESDFLAKGQTVQEQLDGSLSGGYTGRGVTEGSGIYLLYDREQSSWQPDQNHVKGRSTHHSLMFGGMPATEISGIVLRDKDVTLAQAKEVVLENGIYIPIYDIQGELIFTPEEYDAARADLNLSVSVAVWDYSLKTGEKAGSNEGGTFTVPTVDGPVKYYVKFERLDSTDQIWNEHLGNLLYEAGGLAVPKTQVVWVDGSYGHASEIIEEAVPGAAPDIKDGFLMDALLANWDAVYNEANTMVVDGKTVRVDAGGGLLYRAQGGRKELFSEVVGEVQFGVDKKRLGLGMRQMYPGLTEADIKAQAKIMKEKLTDDVIDEKVDSVRLPLADRALLKRILKARRDYIIDWAAGFSESTSTKLTGELEAVVSSAPETNSSNPELTSNTGELTDRGRQAVTLIEEGADADELKDIVPGWKNLTSEEGYQHNGVLLGNHIKEAVQILKSLPEYEALDKPDRRLAVLATFFHDFGKPTGRQDEKVPRDRSHDVPSADIARQRMTEWGFSEEDIQVVTAAILHDGIVSDITRGKGGANQDLQPSELASRLGNNARVLRILRALNTADVLATVGENRFRTRNAYEKYWEQVFESLKST